MKKYVRYLLVLLMCGSLTGVKAQKTFQVDGINYYLDGSEARVSDNRDYSGSKIVIPNSVLYDGKNYPVTSIADSAFYSNWSLIEVTIPNSVTTIGSYAFYSCTGLKKVIWNARNANGFQDDTPFSDCENLTEFVFGDEVEHIPDYLCYNLTSLKNLVIGNSVTNIRSHAFKGCTGLTAVTLPNAMSDIGGLAFAYCTGLTEVTIPNAVTYIGSGAFSGCTGLTEVIRNAADGQVFLDNCSRGC